MLSKPLDMAAPTTAGSWMRQRGRTESVGCSLTIRELAVSKGVPSRIKVPHASPNMLWRAGQRNTSAPLTGCLLQQELKTPALGNGFISHPSLGADFSSTHRGMGEALDTRSLCTDLELHHTQPLHKNVFQMPTGPVHILLGTPH